VGIMTNRVTVFTKPWPDLPLPELARLVRKLGFDAVELPVRAGYQVTPEAISTKLPEAAKILADQGVAIASVAVVPDECSIAACAASGCSLIRLCVVIDMTIGYRATEERIRRQYDALLPALERHGVSIGVQNHCDFCVGSAVGIMHVIEGYDPRQVSAVLDFAHLALVGEPVEMGIEICWSHLSLVNLKSAYRRRMNGPLGAEAAWEVYWPTARDSGFSWRSAVDELRRRGYTRDICLPAEYTGQPAYGQLMGEEAIPPIRYDRAYLRYLMSDASSTGQPFVYEEWAK